MLIDSHSHIDGAEFQLDIDEVFARMKEAEVGGALVAGTSLQDYERGLNFANAHKNVWFAAGVHPSTKDDDHEASIEELVGLTKPQKVDAIGECGLDYYYEEAPYDAQLERFGRHIEAAKLANLPVIVHSRDAQEDTIRLLKEHDAGSTGFVLHCFTGDKKMAQDALDLGGYLSFSGIVTFKNATQIQEVASWVPSDRYLVETDCPYLAPIPFRGKRNEPSYVRYVARKVAFLRGETLEKVAEDSTQNFFRLFSKAELL